MIATAEQEVSAASAREPVIIDGMPAVPAPAGISTGSLDVRMTAESWALIANLQDVGGQDGYDEATETRDCDWDKREQYMALPKDWAYPTVPVADVGSGNVGTSFALRDLAQVHALNKGRCSDWAYAAQFALLRMEIVRAGWVDTSKQTNIILVDPLDDDVALRTLVCDLANLRHKIHQVRTLGYLLPLIAEHGFRTRGIHWRHTNEPGLYTLSYQVLPYVGYLREAENYLPSDLMYSHALDWTGPFRQMQVLLAQLQLPRLPKVLKARASEPPVEFNRLAATAKYIKMLDATKISKLPANCRCSTKVVGGDSPIRLLTKEWVCRLEIGEEVVQAR